MRDTFARCLLPLLLASGAAACDSATAPATSLVLLRAPDFGALVIQTTYQSFFAPSGFWVEQYAVWVAIPPSTTANAGVVVAVSRPVFVSKDGVLARATADSISVGDSIQVWHDHRVGYGAVQAPPDSPCYSARQVLIVR
jgi:hypothetical protein